MKILEFIKNIYENVKGWFIKENSVKKLNEGNFNIENNSKIFKEEIKVAEEEYLEIERKIQSNEIVLENLEIQELKRILKLYETAIDKKKENINRLMNIHKNLLKNNV